MAENIRIIYSGQSAQNSDTLKQVEWISKLLDSKFKIPGTNIRFGIDPIMSLFPVVGDLFTFVISAMLINTMYNHGASRKVVIKMAMNSTFDAILGAIPVVGTIFDVAYRSNDRNVKLLKEHYLEGKHQGSGKGTMLIIFVMVAVILGAAGFGLYKLFEAIF